MRINQNIAAYNSFRNLSATNTQLGKSLEKLSSGFRINRAADDAAGLAKSESLRAEIRGSRQAIRNAQDGVSFVQTAEGALNEVHAILQRMRELAVDAANTATTDGVAQQAEVAELVAEIEAIGDNSTFAGMDIFSDYSGTGAALTFHVGSGASQTLDINSDLRIDTATAGNGVFSVDLDAIDLKKAGGDADGAIGDIDTAIGEVSTVRSTLGATQNRLEHTIANLSVAVENLSASESRVRDTDMAEEMVSFTRHQIMVQAGTAMLAQANQVPSSVLALLQ
ncbi:MAG: flagellin [Acidimicrobiia bacterium]|nr:flagellin [Acidimicrobiia bacterium]